MCYSPSGGHIIAELADCRFLAKNCLHDFMIVTFLLVETMCVIGVPISIKAPCFELLNQRRARIQVLIENGAGDGKFNETDLLRWIRLVM